MQLCLTYTHAAEDINQGNRTHLEMSGYLENWSAEWTKWWDNNIPGNCMMGCEIPKVYMEGIEPYTTVQYGFVLMSEAPEDSQLDCGNPPSATQCPIWDQKALFAAAKSKQDAAVVTSTTTDATSLTAGVVAIGEVCRLARQGPYDVPKRCKITLGGWSDWELEMQRMPGSSQCWSHGWFSKVGTRTAVVVDL
eukprot:m.145887 g.145887  ORF g.145887 m.145887 type:complete len:193 (+) comp17747_c0_seq2:228-806(+)